MTAELARLALRMKAQELRFDLIKLQVRWPLHRKSGRRQPALLLSDLSIDLAAIAVRRAKAAAAALARASMAHFAPDWAELKLERLQPVRRLREA